MTQTRNQARNQADALRAARSRALARRGRAVGAVAATRSFLVCACGPDRFGLPLADIGQVLPMRPVTPLPGAPPAVLGLVALSGRIVSLLALAPALGRPAAPIGGAEHMVVARGAHAAVAFAVDRVLGVVELRQDVMPGREAQDLSDAQAGLSRGAISGYAPPGTGPGAEPGFVIVDLPRLMRRYLA